MTGLVALLIGATTVFAQMQISLNRIWGVVAKPRKSGLLILLKNRMLSLAIILMIGFILLVSLLLNVAALLLSGAELLLSLVVITALFGVIFKVLRMSSSIGMTSGWAQPSPPCYSLPDATGSRSIWRTPRLHRPMARRARSY